jgi:predicted ABC-type ATPase
LLVLIVVPTYWSKIRKRNIFANRYMANLYIIAGCNGAGKTTASFTILPEMLNCKEFVNADSIAAGLSPFNPESVAIEAGRLMLSRIHELMKTGVDFAFETTLATRSYVSLVKAAQDAGYKVTLLFIWIDSPATAMQRVAERVMKGGHNIPSEVIERRYYRGLFNLINLYIPICDTWMVVNNEAITPEPVAEGGVNIENIIINEYIWGVINSQGRQNGNK